MRKIISLLLHISLSALTLIAEIFSFLCLFPEKQHFPKKSANIITIMHLFSFPSLLSLPVPPPPLTPNFYKIFTLTDEGATSKGLWIQSPLLRTGHPCQKVPNTAPTAQPRPLCCCWKPVFQSRAAQVAGKHLLISWLCLLVTSLYPLVLVPALPFALIALFPPSYLLPWCIYSQQSWSLHFPRLNEPISFSPLS